MRVKDDTLKIVAFLAYEDPRGQRTIVGTAFFLLYPIEGVPVNALHIITARHVIEAIVSRGANGVVCVRLNSRDGVKEEWLRIDASQWHFHSDDRIDVAVFVTGGNFEAYDILPLPLDGVATKETLANHDIGIGDELLFPGLYVHRQGDTNNIPILRLGTIASMSTHPVRTKQGPMPAYLCEARSIGGLSGSPVFVRVPVERNPKGYGFVSLLGLIHGHVDAEHTDDSIPDSILQSSKSINSGIAVVVPSHFILETLEEPSCVAFREEMKNYFLNNGGNVAVPSE